jgi:hypothetical protein
VLASISEDEIVIVSIPNRLLLFEGPLPIPLEPVAKTDAFTKEREPQISAALKPTPGPLPPSAKSDPPSIERMLTFDAEHPTAAAGEE